MYKLKPLMSKSAAKPWYKTRNDVFTIGEDSESPQDYWIDYRPEKEAVELTQWTRPGKQLAPSKYKHLEQHRIGDIQNSSEYDDYEEPMTGRTFHVPISVAMQDPDLRSRMYSAIEAYKNSKKPNMRFYDPELYGSEDEYRKAHQREHQSTAGLTAKQVVKQLKKQHIKHGEISMNRYQKTTMPSEIWGNQGEKIAASKGQLAAANKVISGEVLGNVQKAKDLVKRHNLGRSVSKSMSMNRNLMAPGVAEQLVSKRYYTPLQQVHEMADPPKHIMDSLQQALNAGPLNRNKQMVSQLRLADALKQQPGSGIKSIVPTKKDTDDANMLFIGQALKNNGGALKGPTKYQKDLGVKLPSDSSRLAKRLLNSNYEDRTGYGPLLEHMHPQNVRKPIL